MIDKIGTFTFREMDEASARQIVGWQYEAPYDLYNCNPADVEGIIDWFINPQAHYYTVWTETGELIGYCCFGEDARVAGGEYGAEALDIGGGLRPERTGQGLGASFLEALLAFAQRQFAPTAFRATVAAFNQRALHVCEQIGYRPIHSFENPSTHQRFITLIREAKSSD